MHQQLKTILVFMAVFLSLQEMLASNYVARAATTNGLVAHWKFDGDANDSVGTNNGTLTNGPTFTTGKVGGALSFDGVNDGFNINNASFNGTGNITLSMWLFPTNLSSSPIILDNLRLRVRLNYGAVNGINIISDAWFGTKSLTTPANVLTLNTWNHIVITRPSNGQNTQIFVNGSLVATGNSDFPSARNYWTLGQNQSGGGAAYGGKVDEFRYYNRLLSPQEILEIYNYENQGDTPSPPDTTIPTTSIFAPSAGTTVQGTITVAASAADNVGVARVEFYVDGALKSIDTTGPYSFQWDTTNGGTHACLGSHTHTLSTKAYDAAGNIGTSAAVVVNMNDPSYCGAPPLFDTTTGLMAHWKFDDALGFTALDSSGNGNTGTLINGPLWVPGKIGEAIDFDGVNDTVLINPATFNGTGDFTFSGWIYVTGAGSPLIFDNGRFRLRARITTQSLEFSSDAKTGTRYITTSSNSLALNQWQHIAVARPANGVNTIIYMNGVPSNERGGDSGFPAGSTAWTISGSASIIGAVSFDGMADDFRTYNRLLSATEIQAIYAEGMGLPPPTPVLPPDSDLVAYWKFDENGGTSAFDSSGNGNDGILLNGASWTIGIEGSAISFDGVDDSMLVNITPGTFNLDQSDFTLSVWFKEDPAGSPLAGCCGHGTIMAGTRPTSPRGFQEFRIFTEHVADRICIGVQGNEDCSWGNTVPQQGSEWVHLAVVHPANGKNMKIYINGNQIMPVMNTGSSGAVLDVMHIGTRSDFGRQFKGALDEYRIYKRILSPNEILGLYSSPQ